MKIRRDDQEFPLSLPALMSAPLLLPSPSSPSCIDLEVTIFQLVALSASGLQALCINVFWPENSRLRLQFSLGGSCM